MKHRESGTAHHVARSCVRMCRWRGRRRRASCSFDEIDAIGGARFDDGAGGDNEVQRTMLEIVNQLDGFDARGNIKVRARSRSGSCTTVQPYNDCAVV